MAKKTNVVNKSKGTMNLLVILIVAVGWLTVVMALTNDEEAKAQEALAQSAEKYMEDKLYIRAVNAYEEALKTYQTERNSEYEERLLAILKEAGMEDKYHARIKDRISKKTATAEEYIELANVEIEEEDYVNAISILKSGLDVCENDEMVSLYESICYFYDIHELNHTTPVTALENWPIPVYNGEKWGYMSKNGKLLLDFQY